MDLTPVQPEAATPADYDAASSGNSALGPGRGRCLKLAFGGAVFALLTTSIFLYQFYWMESLGKTAAWSGLRLEFLGLMLICLPVDTIASALRIWLVGRVLQPGPGFGLCVQAELANAGIALLTPMQTGGGFGQIYILHRGGVGFAAATTISLITFFGTTVGLLIIGLYSVLVSGAHRGPLFSAAAWPLTIILALMSAALIWPGWFRAVVARLLKAWRRVSELAGREKSDRSAPPGSPPDRLEFMAIRLVELVYDYHRGMWLFIRTGKAHFAGVCLLSLVFILARCLMAFLCLRFLGINNSTLSEVLEIQMALLFLLYFAPTPGSSGLAEVFSLSALAAIVPAGLGPYYNLCWRASTVYLPAGLGLLLLALALLLDTGVVLPRRWSAGLRKPQKPSLNPEVRASNCREMVAETGRSACQPP